MSGIELIGVVLSLYPIVISLAKKYSDLKGSNAADLSTKVVVVSQIYEGIIKRILESALPYQQVRLLVPSDGLVDQTLWQDPILKESLRVRIGEVKLKVSLEYLEKIRMLLDQVRTELDNLCPGTDVLGRVMTRIKTIRAGAEKSPIREKINQIKDLTKELRDLLDDRPFINTYQQFQSQRSTFVINMSQPAGSQAGELFELIKEKYTCACQKPHVVGVGCYCATCAQPLTDPPTFHSEWAFRLACHAGLEAPTEAPTTVLFETVPESDPEAAAIRDLCSLVEEVASEGAVRKVRIGAENNRMYMKAARIDANGKKNPIMTFADLRQPGNGLTPKDRWELALRLCLAIVQLCETPWVNESWTWDVCVSQVSPDDNDRSDDRSYENSIKFPVIFREVYSVGYQADSASIQTAVAPMQFAELLHDDEPVLTKLGLALIELAMGKTMEDIRKESAPADWTASQILADRCMAINLLQTGKIRREASVAYANAVHVCINRKFTDIYGNPSQLVSKHSTFLERFKETVLMPLFEVWKRYEV
ncbi:hypothetical protein B0T21DRAFT_371424 [Apiosordaria backusii]|uniref:DUF7580 domain-containing protein n=1 Tax=Apiosordaria backusii TaxID=314023 RepID=A0AA40B298_9PEZI|nr:hypothetical protein B0T21DRAFT_371424 [Apiosordaria backusii]